MPLPEELATRVLAAHYIREEDGKLVDPYELKGNLTPFQGVAYLEPKDVRIIPFISSV